MRLRSRLFHASRWNEGKIHLGFLYAADPSLRTALRLLPGGLAFKGIVEQLLSVSLDHCITREDEIYMIRRDSIVNPDAAAHYFKQVKHLLQDLEKSAGYLVDVSNPTVEVLSRQEIELIADPRQIAAAYRVPERSVSTNWLADRYAEAISLERLIEPMLRSRVVRVQSNGSKSGQWDVETETETHGPFDYVVNALWEGKLLIDSLLGLQPQSEWSHRYRLSLFVRTTRPVRSPSIVFMIGPFGDAKNYNDRDFYLSWYPAGLIKEDHSMRPNYPELDDIKGSQIEFAIVKELGTLFPSVNAIYEQRESLRLAGGWVFAMGAGSLAEPTSTLHRRDRLGIRRSGTYISVDTGKYSMAPYLAQSVSTLIA